MVVYVLDSNFFIQAHRVTYPLDVAESFWSKVKQLAWEQKIVSIDKVKNEIYHGNDALKDWCMEHLPEDFFHNTIEIMDAYAKVCAWAASLSHHYTQSALNEFLDADEADAFLVAYALKQPDARILVTQEISQPERKSKIKIPDVCIGLSLRYVDTITMFRELGERF